MILTVGLPFSVSVLQNLLIYCSSQPEVKNVAVSNRTNLRLQLMKQQLAEQEKHHQQQHCVVSRVSEAVSMPNCDVTVSTEVPAQILEVCHTGFLVSSSFRPELYAGTVYVVSGFVQGLESLEKP